MSNQLPCEEIYYIIVYTFADRFNSGYMDDKSYLMVVQENMLAIYDSMPRPDCRTNSFVSPKFVIKYGKKAFYEEAMAMIEIYDLL